LSGRGLQQGVVGIEPTSHRQGWRAAIRTIALHGILYDELRLIGQKKTRR
jgi:hypothetical protein